MQEKIKKELEKKDKKENIIKTLPNKNENNKNNLFLPKKTETNNLNQKKQITNHLQKIKDLPVKIVGNENNTQREKDSNNIKN